VPTSAPSYTTTARRRSATKKGSPYSITERRVPELIPVLGSQPAGGESLCDVRLSVRLSVPSIVSEQFLNGTSAQNRPFQCQGTVYRPLQQRAAGLLLWAPHAGDIVT